MSYAIIANIEDPVLGCLYQVTVETSTGADGEDDISVRVNSTLLSPDHPFAIASVKYWLEYVDHLGGIVDLDDHLFNLTLPKPVQNG